MRQGDAMGTVARCCSFIWLKPTAPRIVQAGEDERFEDERFEEGESWTYSSVGEYPHRTEQDEAVAVTAAKNPGVCSVPQRPL